jgi:hypothetical protein
MTTSFTFTVVILVVVVVVVVGKKCSAGVKRKLLTPTIVTRAK